MVDSFPVPRADATLRAVFGNGDGPTWSETAPVEAGASTTFYQPSNSQIPEPFVGSATVASAEGQNLGGVVNEVREGSTMASAYDVVDRGADSAYVPLAYRGFAGWNSGIQVQNVGSGTARVGAAAWVMGTRRRG